MRNFFDLFTDVAPSLKINTTLSSRETPITVLVENHLTKQVSLKDFAVIEKLCNNNKLQEFLDFYRSYDGFDLCIPIKPENCIKKPLLTQLPTSKILSFTNQYLPKGKYAWTIDLNKSQTIYRGNDSWLAFAEVNGGPSCLTIFLDGENAGSVYYSCPQPHFNILKPIAKSFDLYLKRIVKDPTAFLRLIRAHVALKKNDGYNYGYVPVQYIEN